MKKLALCITLFVALMGMVIPSFAQESPSYVDILSVLSTVSEAYPEAVIVEVSLEETTTPICWLVEVYGVLVADSNDDDMLEEEDITICVDALTGIIATEWGFIEDEDDDVVVDNEEDDPSEADNPDEDDPSEADNPDEDDSSEEDASDDEFSTPVMSIYEAIEAARVIYPNGILVYVSLEEEDGAYIWYLVFADSAGVVVEDVDGTVLDYGYDIDDWDEFEESEDDYGDESEESEDDYSDESEESEDDYSDESEESEDDYNDESEESEDDYNDESEESEDDYNDDESDDDDDSEEDDEDN